MSPSLIQARLGGDFSSHLGLDPARSLFEVSNNDPAATPVKSVAKLLIGGRDVTAPYEKDAGPPSQMNLDSFVPYLLNRIVNRLNLDRLATGVQCHRHRSGRGAGD